RQTEPAFLATQQMILELDDLSCGQASAGGKQDQSVIVQMVVLLIGWIDDLSSRDAHLVDRPVLTAIPDLAQNYNTERHRYFYFGALLKLDRQFDAKAKARDIQDGSRRMRISRRHNLDRRRVVGCVSRLPTAL